MANLKKIPEGMKRTRLKDKPTRQRPNKRRVDQRRQDYQKELAELNIHLPQRATTYEALNNAKLIKSYIRETWSAAFDKMPLFKKMSERQIEFARHYAKLGRRQQCLAMRLAGYEISDPSNLDDYARKLIRMDGMNELLIAFEFEEKAKLKVTIEEVVAWFQRIATASMDAGDYANSNRALENLAKYLGMFVEKKEITHRVVQNKQDLDDRIAELTAVLKDAEPEIEARLKLN